MIIFATYDPTNAEPIEALSATFGSELLHLVPKAQVSPESRLVQTDDVSTFETAQALVITGGQLTDWTVDVAMRAREASLPVFFLETHAIEKEQATPYKLEDLVEHAFCGSTISKLTVSSDMGISDQKVSVIGYPFLDGIERRAATGELKVRSLLISGGVQASDQERRELLATAGILKSLGYEVGVHVDSAAQRERWDTGMKIVEEPLLTAIKRYDGIISVPNITNLYAYVAGVPAWHLDSHATDARKVFAQLSSPIENVTDPESGLFAPDMRNADIAEHVIGPADGKAGERLRILLMLSELH
jgi:hypothetical protein